MAKTKTKARSRAADLEIRRAPVRMKKKVKTAKPRLKARVRAKTDIEALKQFTIVSSDGAGQRVLGTYATRRGALIEAKTYALRLRRKVRILGGDAEVKTSRSASFPQRRRKDIVPPVYRKVAGDVGYFVGDGSAHDASFMVQNPRRRKKANPKRRAVKRRNSHLPVGCSVSYKGHAAKIRSQLPGDKYVIKFASGSTMIVAGRSLKKR